MSAKRLALYIVISMVFVSAGYIYLDNSKENDAYNLSKTESVDKKELVLAYASPEKAKKETNIIANDKESGKTLASTDDEKAEAVGGERQVIIDAWDLENTPPEPNDDNADIWIETPFSEEVNLFNEDDRCVENCADALSEISYAEGAFAEQVNPESLRAQAIAEGLIDPDNLGYIPLSDESDKPPPPLETGASIEPEPESESEPGLESNSEYF